MDQTSDQLIYFTQPIFEQVNAEAAKRMCTFSECIERAWAFSRSAIAALEPMSTADARKLDWPLTPFGDNAAAPTKTDEIRRIKVTFTQGAVAQIEAQMVRQGRSNSWLVEKAWKYAMGNGF